MNAFTINYVYIECISYHIAFQTKHCVYYETFKFRMDKNYIHKSQRYRFILYKY